MKTRMRGVEPRTARVITPSPLPTEVHSQIGSAGIEPALRVAYPRAPTHRLPQRSGGSKQWKIPKERANLVAVLDGYETDRGQCPVPRSVRLSHRHMRHAPLFQLPFQQCKSVLVLDGEDDRVGVGWYCVVCRFSGGMYDLGRKKADGQIGTDDDVVSQCAVNGSSSCPRM